MSEVCGSTPLQGVRLLPNFCAASFPVDINAARGVVAFGKTDVLALERGTSSVVILRDTDGDSFPDTKTTVATAPSLNHGLALNGGYVYASSDTTVYRWPYDHEGSLAAGQVGQQETVISNINADGQGGAPQGHTTRTLTFDSSGRLYVSVGSDRNVDPNSYRSRIRRFDLTFTLPIDFTTGEVFADGLRNEVGMAFDRHGILWGVENSADNLWRDDLGGDIHNDNPAEELNRFREEDAGSSWGYPFCWTEFKIDPPYGLGRGTIWAWPSFLNDGIITDEECRNSTIPPEVSLQAHSAPLGIVFYKWKETLPDGCGGGAFPREMDGYAFIAYHGSWNRDIPTGYKVVYVPMDSYGVPAGGPVDLIWHEPPNAKWESGLRPVDVDFDGCGHLIVSSDGTGGVGSMVFRLMSYTGDVGNVTTSPTPDSSSSSSRPTHLALVTFLGGLIALVFIW